MCRYQDYQAKDIPVVERDGARVRVMAGESSGATGPIALRNPGLLLDVTLAKGASFTQQVSERSARRSSACTVLFMWDAKLRCCCALPFSPITAISLFRPTAQDQRCLSVHARDLCIPGADVDVYVACHRDYLGDSDSRQVLIIRLQPLLLSDNVA